MAIPILPAHLVAWRLTAPKTAETEAFVDGSSTPADDAITSLSLQELGTIAGGWGNIDPI